MRTRRGRRRERERLVWKAVRAYPDSTRHELAAYLECGMNDLLTPLYALIKAGRVTRRLDTSTLCGRYRAVAADPGEPPVGLYRCGSRKCGYLFVHDSMGWFYIYDYDGEKRDPLAWDVSRRTDWATLLECQADCVGRQMIPILAYGENQMQKA